MRGDLDPSRFRRNQLRKELGPFHHNDPSSLEELVPAEIQDLPGFLQTVKIQMVKGQTTAKVLLKEREGRAGDRPRNTEPG